MEWKGDVKILYFVTDAPAHGTEYHPITMGDRYPRGDPQGREPKKQVRDLSSRGIDFTIFRVTPQIDKMIEQFDAGYKEGAIGFFTVLDIEKQLGATMHYECDEMMDRSLPSFPLPSHDSINNIFKLGLIETASASVKRRK